MLLRKIHLSLSYLIIAFGLVHIYFVGCLPAFDEYALWFTGSGMAIIYAGLINLIKAKASNSVSYYVCLVTNILTAILFCCALFIMNELQVYVGIALFVVAAFLSMKPG